MTQRPNCPTCKEQLSTGASINGKAQYFCINPECLDRFKTITIPIGPPKQEENMTIQEIRGAVARGWTHKTTEHLEMDSDLAEAITEEICKIDIKANLEYATMFELINELDRRVRLAHTLGEDWTISKRIVND